VTKREGTRRMLVRPSFKAKTCPGGIGARRLRGLASGLFLALLAALLAACAAHSRPVARFGIPDVVVHTSLSDEAQFVNWGTEMPDTTALGIGFVRPEDRDMPPLERPQIEEIRVPEGEPLSSYLLLQSGERATLLVTALVDYQQVPFNLDGQEGLLHEVMVEPGGDLELPLRLEVGEQGAHDLVVIAFKQPYNRPANPQYRNKMFQRLVGRRAVVVVGRMEDPVHSPAPDVVGSPPPPEVTFGLRVSFSTAPTDGETHASNRFMALAQAESNEIFPYQLWVSNYHGETPVDYALVLFQDFHQLHLKGKDMVVVHLEAGHEATIEDSLIVPAEPGVHELQVVYVMDPYRSILRDEVTTPFVFGSNAVGVEVH
jgi:hypothetical protein